MRTFHLVIPNLYTDIVIKEYKVVSRLGLSQGYDLVRMEYHDYLSTTSFGSAGDFSLLMFYRSQDHGILDYALSWMMSPTGTEPCGLPHVTECSLTTTGVWPYLFSFVRGPLTVPFRLDFTVQTARNALIALGEEPTHESIFVDIVIGSNNNTDSTIRRCWDAQSCPAGIEARHYEPGIVTDQEHRSFWIDFNGTNVAVGKGGQEGAFLEWDAGAYHGRTYSQVHFGVASWGDVRGEWQILDDECDDF